MLWNCKLHGFVFLFLLNVAEHTVEKFILFCFELQLWVLLSPLLLKAILGFYVEGPDLTIRWVPIPGSVPSALGPQTHRSLEPRVWEAWFLAREKRAWDFLSAPNAPDQEAGDGRVPQSSQWGQEPSLFLSTGLLIRGGPASPTKQL